jgi:hypothetical protein
VNYDNHCQDGSVIRDDHVVLLDANGVVIEDRTAYTGVSLVGKKY